MRILLVRHAEAVHERGTLDDAARWLSEHGRMQARDVASQVHARGLAPARIVTSPRVRAVQTAELFAAALGFAGEVEALPSLSYTVPAERAADELEALSATQADAVLAAFGHMPTLAEIATRLTRGGYQRELGLGEALYLVDRRIVWSLAPR